MAIKKKRLYASSRTSYKSPLRELQSQASKLHTAGNFAEAKKVYEAGLRLAPTDMQILNLLGVLLLQTAEYSTACNVLSRAVKADPTFLEAHLHLATALKRVGRLEDALCALDRAFALNPECGDLWTNRGNILQEQKKWEMAISAYTRALELDGPSVEKLNNLGNALISSKDFSNALNSYKTALIIDPQSVQVLFNIANLCKIKKMYEESANFYSKILDIDPHYEYARGVMLHSRMCISNWTDFSLQIETLVGDISRNIPASLPFPLLALADNCLLQQRVAEMCSSRRWGQFTSDKRTQKLDNSSRIKVGYYSADFHEHATAHLMAQLFEAHDKQKFEIFAFSFGPSSDGPMRKRLTAAFDHFLDVTDLSDHEIATYSRQLGIHIAVDLKGYTQDSRTGIFAHGCAPIQVNYLGYPGTMGCDYIDYIIADEVVIPPESREYYSEKVIYLPGCYQVNDSTRLIDDHVFTKQELGLPAEGFVFCCFNNNYKITPNTFDSWMRILLAVPGSVLWLLEDNPTAAQNLRNEAQARGVMAERLIFAPRMPTARHLARHRAADLFLDTLPCNAHTTASDALWAGLPLLTLAGESFAARVAASLLTAIEMPELITNNQADYERCAIEIALNPQKLNALKVKLAEKRLTTSLFDGKKYTLHIEQAYQQMINLEIAEQLPSHFSIVERRLGHPPI